jgi:hypothetical protein
MPKKTERDAHFIHSRSTVDENGCWIWDLMKMKNGYGQSSLRPGGLVLAHRLSYMIFRGPIPEGLTIDHLCRVKACVNPDHLEAVTLSVNILRGDSTSAKNARKTHCKRGHEFTPENTYVKPGGGARACRVCHNARSVQRRERFKASA